MKKPLTYWVLLVRVLPPVAFVIPLYTLFTKWNLMGTRLPIILSCMLVNIPLVIWFMVSFFEELPEEVEESGKVDGTTNLIHDYRASVISLVLMQEDSLLVANIAVVCSLFFFCNFPGGNGFRVFQQEHLLADRSSGGVHFNGMYACKKSSK